MNSSNSTENSSMIVDQKTNSNSSTLNLPFETSDDPDIIKTTNTFFASMLKIEWTKSEKYEDYLDKIKSNENKSHLSGLFNQNNIVINSSMIHRYSIKIDIEFETELKRREENIYNWKIDTYEDINTYFTFA